MQAAVAYWVSFNNKHLDFL